MQLKQCDIVMLGGGRMGMALIKGWLIKDSVDRGKLTVVEKDQARLNELHGDPGLAGISLSNQLPQAPLTAPPDILLLAIKPGDCLAALKSCGPALGPQTLVISIAAGIGLNAMAACLPPGQPLLRAMPNTPALALMGATALACGEGVSPSQLALAEELFSAVGISVKVDEGQMDAVTALSGSGPAYVAVFVESMIDAGVAAGLNRALATELALHTVRGAAALIIENRLHPAELKDMVSSPGGTTTAGLSVLERAGLRGIIMEAVKAAALRSRELG